MAFVDTFWFVWNFCLCETKLNQRKNADECNSSPDLDHMNRTKGVKTPQVKVSQVTLPVRLLTKKTEERRNNWESLYFELLLLVSSLTYAPVVRMISVIYIIEFIVSCLRAAAALYIFFISEKPPS